VSHSAIDSSTSRSLAQHLEAAHAAGRWPSLTQGAGTAGGSSSVSGFSQIISQLQALATSDPTQFKQESADIASQLNAAAGQASGTVAQVLQNLAGQFQQAAQTGDLPSLVAHHHRHHRHHGSSACSPSSDQSTASSSSDVSSYFSQYSQNANGYYGPENATSPVTAAIQAGAKGLTVGQTYYVPGVGMCEVE